MPRTPRRSVISVSDIVGPSHRLHSIAMSRLQLAFSGNLKRKPEHIKNNNGVVLSYGGEQRGAG
jgi:hypothetical protein